MKELSILEIQELMSQNKLTAKELTNLFLDRIKEIDQNGPKLNAILEINPDAIKIAEELDQERKMSGSRGKLHGIPIILKDNILTGDQMMTTAGSLALDGYKSNEDAFLVQQLRKAGAVILGKANLSEWANFRGDHVSSGWSSRGGQTRNPYVIDRTPGGSSSGSGVAVAANLCTVAIGTETNGSLLSPSHMNSIVGIKPTIGLVSRTGIIPIAHSQDTAGPMARTVEDAAILLGAISSQDLEDTSMQQTGIRFYSDYTPFLKKIGLSGKRIGVVRKLMGYNANVDAHFDQQVQILKQLGAEIIDPVPIEFPREMSKNEFEMQLYEFKADLNQFLEQAKPPTPFKNLEEIIQFNTVHEDEIMPYFKQEVFVLAQGKGDLNSEEYTKAKESCQKAAREDGIDKIMDQEKLDALIAPTSNPGWPIDLINGDPYTGSSSSLAAISGYPSITVPMGYIHSLPVGISFFGRAFSEPLLLEIAYNYEQASKCRVPPKFLNTIKF